MALATTCPQCKTSFRVVPDQLKLRRGFVRCGRCRNVFAGIDHLRYVSEGQLRVETQAREDAERAEGEPTAPAAAEIPTQAQAETDEARAAATVPGGEAIRETADDADFPQTPLIDAEDDAEDDAEYVIVGPPDSYPLASVPLDAAGSHADETVQRDDARGDGSEGDEQADSRVDEAPPYLERFTSPEPGDGRAHEDAVALLARDGRLDDAAEGESAIDYFSTRRSRGFADRRGIAVAFGVLAFALVLLLQFVVAQRATIAVRAPALAPILGAALAPFGLSVGAPSDLGALTIESFELQASADPDVLEMRALLRNRANHPVRWPSMQLTLTDRSDRVLVRRTLDPDDYLREAGTAPGEGVPPRTEWPLQLALEARDLHLAGYDYRVRLFYP